MAAWIGAGLALGACTSELSLGEDACPRGAKCEVEHVALPQETTEVHTTGTVLAPTWKTSEHALTGSGGNRGDSPSLLATGPEGGVWLFGHELTGLIVTRLGADGSVQEQARVSPPVGLQVSEIEAGSIRAVASHARGPVLGVEWHVACPEQRNCTYGRSEMLVFGSHDAEPESRGSPLPLDNAGDSFDSLHRSADGEAVFAYSPVSGFRKVDLHGNLLWKGTLSLREFDQLPQGASRQSGVMATRSGAISPHGELVLSIDISERTGRWSWRSFPAGLLYLDEDGSRSVRLYESDHVEHPNGEAPEDYPHAALAYDGRGRLLAVYAQRDGDLLVLRVTDTGGGERFRFLREDYADLALHDIAVDPAGTLFIASEGGGREAGSERFLLCRLPEEGTASCVSIPGRPYDIEAPAPGVVFALLGAELARFDFE